MKDFRSILIVVPSRSSQTTLRHLVLNSMTLGKWMDSEVHFVAGTVESQALDSTINELKPAQTNGRPILIIHPIPDSAVERIPEMVEKYSCGLIVLMDGVVLDPEKGTDERRILELSPTPILIFPRDFDFGKSAPQGFLVPLSGDQRTNEALALSLQLAEATGSAVDLLHVMASEKLPESAETLETVGDQLHHEYSQMAEKITSEASPYSSAEERSHVRHVFHCTGFITAEIAKQLQNSPGTILALEWKGTLAEGRAATIKDILQKSNNPVLFVKVIHEEKSILRVGRNLRAA